MKRTVVKFGLISGAILASMMAISMSFIDKIGDAGEVLGYSTMVLAFLLVYFGVRSYRDNVKAGVISFGKAFQVGILITAVATMCYVATWEVIYYKFMPDFMDKYSAKQVEKLKASGNTPEQVEAKVKQINEFKELYKNPLVNMAFTFLEPMPVALVVSLVCAGVLRRKERGMETGMPLGTTART